MQILNPSIEAKLEAIVKISVNFCCTSNYELAFIEGYLIKVFKRKTKSIKTVQL